ncbi:class I SAM-dependent methyltransferase [Cryptosporangium sp. NPDC051539]|uniref:class I SAM-dependent methyltransferase n=1 Tax=Cryptosporangium sp. NPDC051539 TaxID=3363962 RepID=UPI00379FED91
MRKGGSRTAVHVALFRALESARPADRLFVDPYASRFLTPGYRAVAWAARLPPVGRRLERYIDSRWSGGPRGSAVVRTRLIDDWMTAAGAQQALVLGAGFDSRAHRLPALRDAAVFEVDHPATQAVKRRRLPGRVVFVPVDFLRDDLGAALVGAGFDSGARTVVVWEGVTNYLTESAVDATLRSVVGLVPVGSQIVFTYVDRGVLGGGGGLAGGAGVGGVDEFGGFAGVESWRGAVSAAGEPWTFGFVPAELPGYLADRRLRLIDDLSTRDAAALYGREEPTAAFYRVVRAEVVSGAQGH